MNLENPMKFPATFRGSRGQVRVYRNLVRGKVRYTVTHVSASGRKMEYRNDWDGASARIGEILLALDKGLERMASVTASEIDDYLDARERLKGIPVSRAVDFYIANRNLAEARVKDITVASAVRLFEESRAGHSTVHRKAVRLILGRLVRSCGSRLAASLTTRELDKYLASVPNPRTRQNHRAYLVALWNWLQKKDLLPAGPNAASRTERPRIEPSDPQIIGPAKLEPVLRALEKDRPEMVGFVVLGAFAGIREAERRRLTWNDIDWDLGTISLSSSITKTRRRRVVTLPENAMAWLREYRRLGGICPCARPEAVVSRTLRSLGIAWPHNALRHSFVTYHYLLHRNAALTAALAGHSVAEMETCYNGLATRTEAEAWFRIIPNKQTPWQKENCEKAVSG